MEEITPIIDALSKGWTPGGVGIWVLVLSVWVTTWKGLPAILDAWSNAAARERDAREKALAAEQDKREREITRLESQIVASDKRHEECMEGQAKLRMQIAAQDETISKLVLTIRQMQLKISEDKDAPPTPAALASILSRIPQ